MATGAWVAATPPVEEAVAALLALEAAFDADSLTELRALEMEDAAPPVALAPSEVRLATAEEAPASMEETRDEASLATELKPEATAEPSEDSTELMTDEAALTPGTADWIWLATEERTDSTWAEARPAPAIMAMVEKRMLMVWVVKDWWSWVE